MANKINSFQHNYMARRAQLFGILQSNPSWGRGALSEKDQNGTVCRCNIGHVLKVMGHSDADINRMTTDAAVQVVANTYNLRPKTVSKLVVINDRSTTFEQNVRATRALLLNKNESRAKKIIGWKYGATSLAH